MQSFLSMSGGEFRRHVEAVAMMLACCRYRADHSGAGEDETFGYAARHWPSYRGMALDCLVITEAVRENDAAPWN